MVVPRTVLDGLEWDQRKSVATYLEGSGVALRLVPEPVLEGSMNIQVEYELATKSYRVAGETRLAPDESWTAPPWRSVSVLAAGALPEVGGEVVQLESLHQEVPGTFRELKLGKALEGDLRGFGHRFFTALAFAEPRLKEVLEGDSPLSAYRYEDKYVCSPLVVALLGEVLSEVRGNNDDLSGTQYRIHGSAEWPCRARFRASG